MSEQKMVLKAAQIADIPAYEFRHPLDPNSHIFMTGLSRSAGLDRAGVTLSRVPPGRHSFPMHAHQYEEEWIYILSGNATVRIDDEEHTLASGDFVAFPAPGPAHLLHNTSPDQDLVYLMGGEASDFEVVSFPQVGKRMLRSRGLRNLIEEESILPYLPPKVAD